MPKKPAGNGGETFTRGQCQKMTWIFYHVRKDVVMTEFAIRQDGDSVEITPLKGNTIKLDGRNEIKSFIKQIQRCVLEGGNIRDIVPGIPKEGEEFAGQITMKKEDLTKAILTCYWITDTLKEILLSKKESFRVELNEVKEAFNAKIDFFTKD